MADYFTNKVEFYGSTKRLKELGLDKKLDFEELLGEDYAEIEDYAPRMLEDPKLIFSDEVEDTLVVLYEFDATGFPEEVYRTIAGTRDLDVQGWLYVVADYCSFGEEED